MNPFRPKSPLDQPEYFVNRVNNILSECFKIETPKLEETKRRISISIETANNVSYNDVLAAAESLLNKVVGADGYKSLRELMADQTISFTFNHSEAGSDLKFIVKEGTKKDDKSL